MSNNPSATIRRFLSEIEAIAALNPTYRQPGDGSDGTCDCIGLIIGALRRMGLKWSGIHGTNWAARREVTGLKSLTSAAQLSVGDIVFKARSSSSPYYRLPARYTKGKSCYNGDLTDYYHVGVVTSLSPLTITHMSTGGIARAHTLKGWTHLARLKALGSGVSVSGTASGSGKSGNGQDSGSVVGPAASGSAVKLPSTGISAVVTAPSGRFVKMRQQPSAKCRLYEEVPVGATVTLLSPGETWAQISYGRRKGWYMMAKYLSC